MAWRLLDGERVRKTRDNSLAMGAGLPWNEVCAIWRKMKKHLRVVSSLRTLPPILAAKNLNRQEGHESTIREITVY
jgi:hypothetical protein